MLTLTSKCNTSKCNTSKCNILVTRKTRLYNVNVVNKKSTIPKGSDPDDGFNNFNELPRIKLDNRQIFQVEIDNIRNTIVPSVDDVNYTIGGCVGKSLEEKRKYCNKKGVDFDRVSGYWETIKKLNNAYYKL